jgi:L-fuculose-phosphate aldolase
VSTRAEEQIRADIVEAGRRMYERGFVASNDGNISSRLDERRLITSPTGVSKGFMTPDMMVIVDYDGKKLSGDRNASSELPMHLEIYRNRPDVNAVVHAHPPTATGFAVAGIPLTRAVLAEVITTLGSIPIAAYGTPSTAELPEAVRKYIKAHDGMLLANHGAVTCGPNVFAAYYKMETIEHFARISLVARTLGGENLISREEVERLQGLRGVAPESSERLVPELNAMLRQARGPHDARLRHGVEESRDGEIRLTYGELTALIADAVKNLGPRSE